ncbi:hypothetical protein [Cupriavidus pauculus]|uniref:Uncharacterized protein n=1 Tax=Cupriavidus pauculus TaxID=82633 RepID=A0A2N5CB01_9BURK|nr:hypothetical protein [Cupriavidus pauculus]PLP99376.1 hypothetical protein CYJ10_16195 [Cupriavidus pauculus]
MASTYRRYTINCNPQLLGSGEYSPHLVVTEHRANSAVDHVIDLGPDVYRTAQEASQKATSAGMRWVDARIGPIHRYGDFGYEVSAASKVQARWTGEVRVYGSSSPANIFDRRTGYLTAPGIFRSDGEAMVVARAYAIQMIDAGTLFTWADA